MKVVNYEDLQENLESLLDGVVDNRTPVCISCPNQGLAVLMSLDDYNSYEETLYLLKSPSNAKHLLESVAQIKSSKHQ